MSDFIRRRDQWIKQVCMSPALNGTQTRVLTMFAFHADNQTGESFISNRALGEEVNISAWSVSKAMSAGKDAGFIFEVSRGGTSTGTRLTSVRRCIFPSAAQTHVQEHKGTETADSQTLVHTPKGSDQTLVPQPMDPLAVANGPFGESTMTLGRTPNPTKPLTNPLTNPDNSLGNTSLGNVREEEPTMSGFDRFMAEAEAKSAQATASSSEVTLSDEEINEYWNELNDSATDEDHKEVAALPAGDKGETSSGESSPVHAGAVALEESTPEPVAVSDGPHWGTFGNPSDTFFASLRIKNSLSGESRSHWNGLGRNVKKLRWKEITGYWPGKEPATV